MLCQITDDESPAFVLNTNRGSCISQDSGMSGQVTLTGTVTLNAPTTYSARIVTLASDLKLITLGWPLSIQAHTFVIKGSPQIISFDPRDSSCGVPGRSAASITINASNVTGTGLGCLNST
jgi:hypothetical protein